MQGPGRETRDKWKRQWSLREVADLKSMRLNVPQSFETCDELSLNLQTEVIKELIGCTPYPAAPTEQVRGGFVSGCAKESFRGAVEVMVH